LVLTAGTNGVINMKKMYEILNNNAFVVTRDEKNELMLGFYHDVFDKTGDTMRIFEPIAPVKIFSMEEILNYINNAE